MTGDGCAAYLRVSIEAAKFSRGEVFMEGMPAAFGSRRNEDIALDMMKFIASTTQYGRATSSTPGFSGTTSAKPEDYAAQLIELYGRCLNAVQGKR
jgi:hypothetical protein